MNQEQSQRTKDILKKVRQIEIRTNRMVTDALAGAYHSIFKGQGMDFEEVREYAPGDDVRSIDWNVTAKMDKPFVKKHREERELTMMLMVDLSGSGDYGSVEESKRELAAQLASVLAFSATRNNDKVGLILFTDKVERYVPAKKGRQHVLRLIRDILFHEPQGRGTDIHEALDTLNPILKRRSIVFLFSDFHQQANSEVAKRWASNKNPLMTHLDVTNKRHDLVCVHVSDPNEYALPQCGIVTLQDAETGETFEINTQDIAVRKEYERITNMHKRELFDQFKTKGIDSLSITTGSSFMEPLKKFLQQRMIKR